MLDRITSFWQRLSDSLWFLPAVLVCGAILFAFAAVHLSTLLDAEAIARFPRMFGASAEGSRSMLSMIAGSMVTVAGVTFSVLVVAVSQASSQYTPRVMRNFMRDRLSQVTLGVLVGVFVYCLVVLRTVRTGPAEFVPGLAVLAAMLLALLAVALLMYFIHHIAGTLEAGRILDSIAEETAISVDRVFPEPCTDDSHVDLPVPAIPFDGTTWHGIPAHRSGYIQNLDIDGIMRTAARCDAVVRMERAIGEFVAEGTALASISGHAAGDEVIRSVNDHYVIASYRTVFQDPGFGIRQMVDIALKALSPGTNDPTTAVTCINYLAAVLVQMASRRFPAPERALDGTVRLITRDADFATMLDEAFTEIRQSASSNARVLVRAVGALEFIAGVARSPKRREALRTQLERFRETLQRLPALPADRDPGIAACNRLQGLLEQPIAAAGQRRRSVT